MEQSAYAYTSVGQGSPHGAVRMGQRMLGALVAMLTREEAVDAQPSIDGARFSPIAFDGDEMVVAAPYGVCVRGLVSDERVRVAEEGAVRVCMQGMRDAERVAESVEVAIRARQGREIEAYVFQKTIRYL